MSFSAPHCVMPEPTVANNSLIATYPTSAVAHPHETPDELAQYCHTQLTELIPHTPLTEQALAPVREQATQWAQASTPLPVILRAYHTSTRKIITHPPARIAHSGSQTQRILELLEEITAAVTTAYLAEQQSMTLSTQATTQSQAAALLSGHSRVGLAAPLPPRTDSYQVAALAISAHETLDQATTTATANQRLARRVQSSIVSVFTTRALSLCNHQGGTLLLPDDGGPLLTEQTLTQLERNAEVSLTVAVAEGTTASLPELAERTHDLLRLVGVLGRPPGLYRESDLAWEYRLARDESATERLTAIVDPIAAHPELFETMRAYLRHNMNRQLTARQLYVHPNTVDYRLRRITQLTTLDLTTAQGITQAAIALMAYDLGR